MKMNIHTAVEMYISPVSNVSSTRDTYIRDMTKHTYITQVMRKHQTQLTVICLAELKLPDNAYDNNDNDVINNSNNSVVVITIITIMTTRKMIAMTKQNY